MIHSCLVCVFVCGCVCESVFVWVGGWVSGCVCVYVCVWLCLCGCGCVYVCACVCWRRRWATAARARRRRRGTWQPHVWTRHGRRQTEVSTYTVGNRALAPSTQGCVIPHPRLTRWQTTIRRSARYRSNSKDMRNRQQVTSDTQNCCAI